MSQEFQFSTISMACGYAGLYRQGDEPFNVLVGDDGRPVMFETSLQAIRAARERVLPPPAVQRPPSAPIDLLGVADWRQEKAAAFATGQLIRKTGSFRPFVVERKGKRRVVPKL